MKLLLLLLLFLGVDLQQSVFCIMSPKSRPEGSIHPTQSYRPQTYLHQHQLDHLDETNKNKIQLQDHQGDSNGDNKKSTISIEMGSSKGNLSSNGSGVGGSGVIYMMVRNTGLEPEWVTLSLNQQEQKTDPENTNHHHQIKILGPTQFHLEGGGVREVGLMVGGQAVGGGRRGVTLSARGKRTVVAEQRTFFLPDVESGYGGLGGGGLGGGPFCYDRYVTGTCRYRQDPVDCLNYEWVAYATIQNPGGLYSIRSIPEGLFVPDFIPGTRDRVRVFMRVSCCTPYVQFVASDHFFKSGAGCIVDVRELQALHPAEIAGIVIGGILLLVLIMVVIGVCLRRQRGRTILVGHTQNPESPTTTTRDRQIRHL